MPHIDEQKKLAKALKHAVGSIPTGDNKHLHKTRHVARRYFGFTGNKAAQKITGWYKNPSSITAADALKIQEVLKTLGSAGASVPAALENAQDCNRSVQRHAVSVLSSLKAIIILVDPKTVADDTRMSVKSSLEAIGRQFGLTHTYNEKGSS